MFKHAQAGYHNEKSSNCTEMEQLLLFLLEKYDRME